MTRNFHNVHVRAMTQKKRDEVVEAVLAYAKKLGFSPAKPKVHEVPRAMNVVVASSGRLAPIYRGRQILGLVVALRRMADGEPGSRITRSTTFAVGEHSARPGRVLAPSCSLKLIESVFVVLAHVGVCERVLASGAGSGLTLRSLAPVSRRAR